MYNSTTASYAEGGVYDMVQTGAASVTWPQVVLELWLGRARQETAIEVQKVTVEHAGDYGQRMRYVLEMFAVGGRAS